MLDILNGAPIHFEANVGQADTRFDYLARQGGYTLFLRPDEAVVVLGQAPASAIVRLGLVGTSPTATAVGAGALPGRSNYLVGDAPAAWRTNVPHYARVDVAEIYPGIDLTYYGNGRELESDFVVGPGADPANIRFTVAGARRVFLDRGGNLVMRTKRGDVIQRAPVAYQQVRGARKTIRAGYRLRGARQVGIAVGSYDRRLPLVIDPVLTYSSYLGGSGDDYAMGIAVDGAGYAYVVGTTGSPNFPTASAFQATPGSASNVQDVFVTKLNPASGTLVYSTYLGGGSGEIGRGIAVDSSGSAYVTGLTSSSNFPTANPFRSFYGAGPSRAFVTKLSPSGSSLVYSTYLGGNGADVGAGIAVDISGSASVAGYTSSTDFPTVAPAQATRRGSTDAFVTRFNPAGSALVYSTYLGGSTCAPSLCGGAPSTNAYGIAVDGSGNAYVAGETSTRDFPTVGAFQPAALEPPSRPPVNGFVAKLSASGSLAYSTYLGGANGDGARAIAVDAAGSAYVTGWTNSNAALGFVPGFPTTPGAFQPADPCESELSCRSGFVSKLSPSGSTLSYSTYLGQSCNNARVPLHIAGVAVDVSGNLYATSCAYYDVSHPNNALCPSIAAASAADVLVAGLNATGTGLVSSICFGGTGNDAGHAIAVAGSGAIYVAGQTSSTNFPTANPFQGTSGGGFADTFVVGLSNPTPPAGSVRLNTLVPCRVIDTRDPAGPLGGPALGANTDRTFPLSGTCGIPSSAKAVSLNLAVTGPTAAGNLRVYPAGNPLPLASAVNYSPGQTRANNAVVALNSSGQIAVRCDQAGGTVHLILDINGYFE